MATFDQQRRNPNARGTEMKMMAAVVLLLSCSAVAVRADVPSRVVSTLLRNLVASEYPVKEAHIVGLLPVGERSYVERVEQESGHDLRWTSADKTCYVTFMIEDARAGHVWGRCSFATLVEAKEALSRWVAALPPLENDHMPSGKEPFVHTFLRGRSVAVDLSIQQDNDRWLVGFGLRSGVPHDPAP